MRPDPKFPWGENNPTRGQRLAVALCVATLAACITQLWYERHPGIHSDFALAWFGAGSLLHHVDPYPLVGPGLPYNWQWHLVYPATVFVAAIPFAALTEQVASVVFVWISTLLLAYGMTRQSWHLLPLFVSYSFISSAWLAQWSIIFTAAVFLPWIAFLSIAKPPTALPVVGGSPSMETIKYAAIGGVVLTIASLVLLPGWPREWLALARADSNYHVPITALGGVLVLLVLLRWRRSEAWLVLLVSLMPATSGWYNALVILTIAATYREACVLSLLSTLGVIGGRYALLLLGPMSDIDRFVGAVMIATIYVPAVVVVLRRPNEGEMPAWLRFATERITR